MMRVVGNMYIAFRDDAAIQDKANDNKGLSMSLQLIPAVNGLSGVAFAKDTFNSSDLDSTNIVWKRMYMPGLTNSNIRVNIPDAIGDYFALPTPDPKLDIKSRRRFDRSQWALALVASIDNGLLNQWGIAYSMRMLIQSSGGI